MQVGKEIDDGGSQDGNRNQQQDHHPPHIVHRRFNHPGGDQYGIVPADQRGVGGGEEVLFSAGLDRSVGGRFSGLQVFFPGNRTDAQQQRTVRIGDLDASAVFLRDPADVIPDPGGRNQVGGAQLGSSHIAGDRDEECDILRFLSAVLAHGIRRPGDDVFRPVHGGVEVFQRMAGVYQLVGKQLFRADPGGRGEAVFRPGPVGDQVVRQGRDGMQDVQGIHCFPGCHHVAFIGPEIHYGIVLDHEGDVYQLFQLGIHIFLDLGQQAGVVVGDFLLIAVQEDGIEERKKKDDRQKKHERVGKNIAIEGNTFAFHLPGRLLC